MRHFAWTLWVAGLTVVSPALSASSSPHPPTPPTALKRSLARLETELASQYGEAQRERLRRGLRQAASLWRPADGDAATFETFVRQNFAGTQAAMDTMFGRFEPLIEALDGHLAEIGQVFRRQMDLDLGPVLPFDEVFGGYEPAAHVAEDFFQNKLAFVVLLNFPLTTLAQRLTEGETWTRRQWAETRLAQRFARRIPASVNQTIAQATAEAELYITEYKIWMHHILGPAESRPFPPKLRLVSHWNLRDEIKGQYRNRDGLARQRLIQRIMERIITQSIPQVVINSPYVDWDPVSNEVKPAAVNDSDAAALPGLRASSAPEPDTRYAKLLKVFQAVKMADPYSPTAPTWIARKFDEDRQIPEARVKAMLEEVLGSPLLARTARLIATRLGRPLEPFDIWYDGFRPNPQLTEAQLDELVAQKYPTAAAFRNDMPNLLVKLGFTRERAQFLHDHILVEPSRGTGHAMGAALRGLPARLRTRVGAGGMDYKGYNIALHELGHNVEQTFSLNLVDHSLLHGVPNNAFTEALAYVFQERDFELLGLPAPDARHAAYQTLGVYWMTCEIAAVALVDMAVWRWMYDHPKATPAQLKAATLDIARQIWNQYFSSVFGQRDVILLAVYSHMINNLLYLPDYPLGHLIAFQIEEQMKRAGNLGVEFERMAKFGNVTPDAWMKNATGAPVGPAALLSATQRALAETGQTAAAWTSRDLEPGTGLESAASNR